MRPGGLAGCALAVFLSGGIPSSAAADSTGVAPGSGRYPDRTMALVGAGAGIVHVGLPDPNRPGTTFGTKLRVGFDLGYEARPWLEIGGDLAFGELGESDSLRAVLRQRGIRGASAFTLVLAGAELRVRWIRGSGRWAPCVRAGGGIAGLSLSSPVGQGSRRIDPAWNAGGGLEFYAHPRFVLRAEALYIGQTARGGARHHSSIGLALLYAVPRPALTSQRLSEPDPVPNARERKRR